jgi:DNA-binding NarL/FixJ family response regulator
MRDDEGSPRGPGRCRARAPGTKAPRGSTTRTCRTRLSRSSPSCRPPSTALREGHATGDAVVAPSVTRRLLDAYAHRLPAAPSPGARAEGHPAIAPLTPREREILTEIAAGRTNAEIAERLVLEEATVKTHVGNIFHKLDLRDRVQAVILAYEVGLVR